MKQWTELGEESWIKLLVVFPVVKQEVEESRFTTNGLALIELYSHFPLWALP